MVKNPPANAGETGDTGLIPRSQISPGKGNGNLLQYSCLEKSHGQSNLGGCSPWGHKRVTHDLVTRQQHIHTTMCKTVWGPVVSHRELSPVLCGDLDGQGGVGGRPRGRGHTHTHT